MDKNEPQRAELYVRSLAPSGTRETQDAIVDRLRHLERNGLVDEIDLTVWGDAVCLENASSRVGVGAAVAERIQSFHDWCRNTCVSLDPFFTWSSVESTFAGDSHERVIPPQRCLAVYVGDRLRAVYPCAVDGVPRSLEDGLRRLERDERGPATPLSVPEEMG